ncbi:MAG: medium chain dehydrogenase/reductase family protein [Nocardioidaceae bacterium]
MSIHTTEVVLPGLVEPDGLQVRERTIDEPGQGQALVRVEATGVSFAEKGMRRGRYPGQPAFPFVPGYDLVGTVAAVGPGVDEALVGRRFAALTKTGGWSTYVVLAAADLVDVPAGLDPAEAESMIVNGVTAWQMLHRDAKVGAGDTVLVHGANGGVGTVLVQLARLAGATVVGTAAPRHHEQLRAMGVQPVDYRDPALADRLAELAPAGFDAVFDHLGGDSFRRSFAMLAPGGTLVCYGTAAGLEDSGSVVWLFVRMLVPILLRDALPNGHHATFYNLWGGSWRRAAFRTRLHTDLTGVFALLSDGALTAHVAARLPLTEAGTALALAESRTVLGKVVLLP